MLVDQFGGQIVSGLAGNLGLGENDARGAIDGALPSILGGLINKVGTSAGTDELFDIVKDDEYGGGMLDNLGSLFGGGENSSLLQTGLKLLPLILGGGSKMGTVLDIAGRVFGGGQSRSKSVFGMLAPLVISFIGKRLRGSDNGMNKSGLVDLLLGQKQNVATRANPEIAKEMGFSHWLDRTANVSSTTEGSDGYREERTHTTTHHEEEKTGGGFPKWLWPLLLLGLLGFLAFSLMKGCGGNEVENRTIDKKQDTKIERQATPNKKIEGNKQPVKNQKPVVNNQIKSNSTKTNQVVTSQPVRTNTSTTTTTNNTTTTTTNNATNTRPGRGNTSTANSGSTTTTSTTTPGRAGATTTTGTAASGGTRSGSTQGGSTYTGASKQFNDAATSGASSVINFGSVSPDGKALSAAARAQLDQIAAIMKANPDMKIEVRGHNKDHGNKVQNGTARAASKVRAKLVEAHLATKGVGASRVKTSSLGHDEVLGGVAATDDKQKRITIKTMN